MMNETILMQFIYSEIKLYKWSYNRHVSYCSKFTLFFLCRFRQGFIRCLCCCPFRPCKRIRSHMRIGRTLFPTNQSTMSEKYARNGSMMHTMTEYYDDSSSTQFGRCGTLSLRHCDGRTDSDDYVWAPVAVFLIASGKFDANKHYAYCITRVNSHT